MLVTVALCHIHLCQTESNEYVPMWSAMLRICKWINLENTKITFTTWLETIFIKEEKTLVIKRFGFDSEGPDSFFLVGTKDIISRDGTILPHPFDGIFYHYEDEKVPIL